MINQSQDSNLIGFVILVSKLII